MKIQNIVLATLLSCVFFFIGCDEGKGNEKLPLIDTENLYKTWVLVEKKKGNITEVMPDFEDEIYSVAVTLTFSPTNTFRGSCDNNTYDGTYTISDSGILFSNIMFTDGSASNWYKDYISIISNGAASTYKLLLDDANNLLLSNQTDSIALKFISKDMFEDMYYKLNGGGTDSTSCENKEILKILNDEPAIVRKQCFEHVGRVDAFFFELANQHEGLWSVVLFPAEEIPQQFRKEGLSVYISGNVIKSYVLGGCSEPNIRLAHIPLFELKSITSTNK